MLQPTRHHYGPRTDQFGDLYLPANARGAVPVVVLIHGGSWLDAYDLSLMDDLAMDITARGWAAWNIEYRRIGSGGGWPQTAIDVCRAVDHLADLAAMQSPIDLDAVALVGHSAGGHLALLAALRRDAAAAPCPQPRVHLRGVVAQAAMSDLRAIWATGHADGVTEVLLGGAPSAVPAAYAAASPIERLPIGIPLLVVHGADDASIPCEISRDLAARARAAGDTVDDVRLAGVGHMEHIDPSAEAWHVAARWLAAALGSPDRSSAARP